MVNINKNDLTTTYKKDLYEAPSYRWGPTMEYNVSAVNCISRKD